MGGGGWRQRSGQGRKDESMNESADNNAERSNDIQLNRTIRQKNTGLFKRRLTRTGTRTPVRRAIRTITASGKESIAPRSRVCYYRSVTGGNVFGVFMKATGGRNDGDPDVRGGLLMHFVWWVCRSFSRRWGKSESLGNNVLIHVSKLF